MAAINSIIFDMTNNMNITKDIQQAIIQGQKNNIKIRLYFENEPFNYAWDINNVFTRPDGSKSNNIPAIAKDGYFELTLRSWMTDIHGELKIATRIFISGEEYMAFDSVTLLVQESETPSGDTITETQYDAILGAVASKATQAEMDDTTGRVGDLDEDKLNRDGSQAMLGDLDMDGNKLKNAKIDNGVADDDPVNKRQLDEKVPESQLDYDKNANTVPVRNASGNFKVGIAIYTDEAVNKGVLDGAILSHKAANNTFTGNNIFTNVVKIPDGVAAGDAVNKGQLDEKVPKTRTIAGIDLTQNRTAAEITASLMLATTLLKGLMSADDKVKLDALPTNATLVSLLSGKVDKDGNKQLSDENFTSKLKEDLETLIDLYAKDEDGFINKIEELLEVFATYPEGTDILELISGKVTKNDPIVEGTYPKTTFDSKGLVTGGEPLSENDIPQLSQSKVEGLVLALSNLTNAISNHVTDKNNPHEVGAEQIEYEDTNVKEALDDRYKKDETYNQYEVDTKIQDMLYFGVFIVDLGHFTDTDVDLLIDLGGF